MTLKSEEHAAALADACRLLGASARLPTPELTESIVDGSLTASARALLPWLAFGPEAYEKLEGRLAACEAGASTATLSSLRKDYTRLLGHPTSPLVLPCESLFKSRQHGEEEKPLLMVNRLAMALDQEYRAAGYERARGRVVPPDHLATELEFAALLLDERPEEAEGFVGRHLAGWAPAAFLLIEQHADTPAYALFGCLGTACFRL